MRRRRLARDDEALAGVVGFVLLLAVAMSYYAYVVQTDVPRWGAQSERAWDEQVGAVMAELSRDADNALATGTELAALLPRPPAPEGLDLPLLGRTQPLQPHGALTFAPGSSCGGLELTQHIAGRDARSAASGGGCLRFHAAPAYSAPFGYALEHGALLRVQGSEAAVLRGPLLSIQPFLGPDGTTTRFDVGVRLEELRGPAFSLSVQQADAHVRLAADQALAPREAPKADTSRLDIVIRSEHARAWALWLEEKVASEALNAPAACPSGSCVTVALDAAAGAVTLTIRGPVAADTSNDVALSLEESSFRVSAR